MQISGKGIKLKLDYSGNETRLKGVIDCPCGKKVIIDEIITDSSIDFEAEKINAEAVNLAIHMRIPKKK